MVSTCSLATGKCVHKWHELFIDNPAQSAVGYVFNHTLLFYFSYNLCALLECLLWEKYVWGDIVWNVTCLCEILQYIWNGTCLCKNCKMLQPFCWNDIYLLIYIIYVSNLYLCMCWMLCICVKLYINVIQCVCMEWGIERKREYYSFLPIFVRL